MKRFLRRIGAIRSTIMAAGIVAAAVGVQVVRADEHMPGFPPTICVPCCKVTYTGSFVCTPAYECQSSLYRPSSCGCIPIVDSQGRIIGALGICIDEVPQ